MNHYFPSMFANDHLTGKKSNKFIDVLSYYMDDVGDGNKLQVFVLKGRSGVGCYLASFGVNTAEKVGDWVNRSGPSSTKEMQIVNIITIDSSGVVGAHNDDGLLKTDKARPLWVMK